ncbi:transposase [Streptomyces sp. MMS24-I2-30]|uniref:transposase n=1 Tax=Streptomyces sp. MMS24-I2-30 TaxID=3351564 RepID=UPI003896CB9B
MAGWGGLGLDRVLRGEAVAGPTTGRSTWSWIVPDGLWEIADSLIPPSRARPQGGGTQDTPDETLFAAISYVLVSGCAWLALPPIQVDRSPSVPDLVQSRCLGPPAPGRAASPGRRRPRRCHPRRRRGSRAGTARRTPRGRRPV